MADLLESILSFLDPLNPQLWIVGGIVLAIATFIMIYFKVFLGEMRGRVRENI